jgi:hypothetical protein
MSRYYLEFFPTLKGFVQELGIEEVIKKRDSHGRTMLMEAVIRGDPTCVEYLLKHGADPFVEDNDKLTAWDWFEMEGLVGAYWWNEVRDQYQLNNRHRRLMQLLLSTGLVSSFTSKRVNRNVNQTFRPFILDHLTMVLMCARATLPRFQIHEMFVSIDILRTLASFLL